MKIPESSFRQNRRRIWKSKKLKWIRKNKESRCIVMWDYNMEASFFCVTVDSVHSNTLRDAQKSCFAWFRAATLGFSVNFVHKKHLAEYYQWTVTLNWKYYKLSWRTLYIFSEGVCKILSAKCTLHLAACFDNLNFFFILRSVCHTFVIFIFRIRTYAIYEALW